MLHGRFGELLVDFLFELLKLSLYFFIGRNFSGRGCREGIGVFACDEVDAPRLQLQGVSESIRVRASLADQVG